MAGIPYTSLVPAMPLPTSSAWLNWFYGAPILGSQGLLQQRLQRVPRVRAITYFFSQSAGNDSNDGFDNVGFNLSGATYTASTQYITKSGAFSSYTFTPGDLLYISGATGIATGLYKIAGAKIDNNNIQLVATADTTIDGTLAAPTSNGTGISSSTGPWKTWAKSQTQLATYTTDQVVNTRFRFRRSDTWAEATSTAINCANFTMDDYGIGEKPFINAHGLNVIAPASWSPVAGNVYSVTVPANTISIRFQNHRLDTPFMRVFNQGSDAANKTFVAANPNSFCVDASNLLSVNFSGNDPRTFGNAGGGVPMETNIIRTTDGLDVNGTVGNVRVMNIRMDGFGQTYTTNLYTARSLCVGETVFEGIEAYFTGYHAIAGYSTSTTGLITTFKDCKAGYTTLFASNPGEITYVSFSGATSGNAGEQIYENCFASYGTIPTDTSASLAFPLASTTCGSFYSHTSGANWALYIRSNCTTGSGNTYLTPQLGNGGFGGMPTANNASGGLAACRGIVIGDKLLGYPYTQPSTGFKSQNMCNINCVYQVTPVSNFAQAVDGEGAGGIDNGWFINSILSIDLRFIYGTGGGYPGSAQLTGTTMTMYNSLIEFFNGHGDNAIGYQGGVSMFAFNNIFRFQGADYNPFPPVQNYLGITNNAANIGGNVYAGMCTPGGGSNIWNSANGFSADPSFTILPGSFPIDEQPNVTTQYLNKGVSIPADAGGAIQVQYDINFNARPTTNPTPGPYEYVAYPSNLGGSGDGSDAGQRGNPFTNASVGGIIQDLA